VICGRSITLLSARTATSALSDPSRRINSRKIMLDVSEKFPPRVESTCLAKSFAKQFLVKIFIYCRQLEQSVLTNLEEICLSPPSLPNNEVEGRTSRYCNTGGGLWYTKEKVVDLGSPGQPPGSSVEEQRTRRSIA
jgi:hypothetical protein